jgi:hypothetical protein
VSRDYQGDEARTLARQLEADANEIKADIHVIGSLLTGD